MSVSAVSTDAGPPGTDVSVVSTEDVGPDPPAFHTATVVVSTRVQSVIPRVWRHRADLVTTSAASHVRDDTWDTSARFVSARLGVVLPSVLPWVVGDPGGDPGEDPGEGRDLAAALVGGRWMDIVDVSHEGLARHAAPVLRRGDLRVALLRYVLGMSQGTNPPPEEWCHALVAASGVPLDAAVAALWLIGMVVILPLHDEVPCSARMDLPDPPSRRALSSALVETFTPTWHLGGVSNCVAFLDDGTIPHVATWTKKDLAFLWAVLPEPLMK